MQWIVPGLNSLREGSRGSEGGVGYPRARASWGNVEESILELVEEMRGLSGTNSSAKRTGQPWCHRTQWLTRQDPGDVTHSQPRGSEID